MVLLGDKAHLDALFNPFGDSANLMQDMCTFCAECTKRLKNHFGQS
jgi:hypothetical protein